MAENKEMEKKSRDEKNDGGPLRPLREPLQTRQSAWRALLIIGFCSPSSMFENVLRLDQRCLAYLHLTYCQTFLRLSRALQARMFAFCAFFRLFLGRRGVWTGLRGMKEQLARDVDGVTRI